jgi:cysteinyl-tRNA synthetase
VGGAGGPDGRCGPGTAGCAIDAIEALLTERTLAKKQRNFGRADQIRKELAEKGIVIEDSKDGVRWKRK